MVDEHGDPVQDATVVLVDGPGEFPDIAAVSGEDGSFSFSLLSEGAYRVDVLSPAGERAEGWFRATRSPSEEAILTVRT